MSNRLKSDDWQQAIEYLDRYLEQVKTNPARDQVDKAALLGCAFAYRHLYDAGDRSRELMGAILALE